MCIDNHLTKRIVCPNRKIRSDRNIFKQLEHGGNALWMNAVFGFFEAKEAFGLWIEFEDRKS